MLFLLKNILILGSMAFGSQCDLLHKLPQQTPFPLSDGSSVQTPTIARDFDSYAISGLLNFDRTVEFLKQDGVRPVNMGGRALGVLSVYNYKDSDMGSFQEAYFVVLVEGLSGHSRSSSIFHVRAWSNSRQGALASKEIWGIPSELAEIKISAGNDFKVQTAEGSIFEMHFGNGAIFHTNLNQKLNVNAVGPLVDGKQKWSPVKACRKITASHFSPSNGDNLVVYNLELQKLLSDLGFKPVTKEIGKDQQAIQFLPQ
jgi:hypothetical protein